MNLSIEDIPYCRIAYIRQVGPYGQNNVQIMEQLKGWARSKCLMDDHAIILGIAHDNPELVEPQNCRYDTCIVISDDYCIHDDYITKGFISGGKYAVFLICHTAEAVQSAWQVIFHELFTCNYQMDETRPILERYKMEVLKKNYCEICVPVY